MFLLLAAPAALLTACGYHTLGAATHLPEGVRTLSVPQFATRTEAYHTETVMTDAVIREFAARTRFRVTPVVGFLPELPGFRPHAAEVAEIVLVPLAFFENEENVRVREQERNGRRHTVYSYPYGEYDIWGATAAIIRMFLRTIADASA